MNKELIIRKANREYDKDSKLGKDVPKFEHYIIVETKKAMQKDFDELYEKYEKEHYDRVNQKKAMIGEIKEYARTKPYPEGNFVNRLISQLEAKQ